MILDSCVEEVDKACGAADGGTYTVQAEHGRDDTQDFLFLICRYLV